jgi:hypothetical protein
MMDEYRPIDVTRQAQDLAGDRFHQASEKSNKLPEFQHAATSPRKPGVRTLDASRNHFPVKIDIREKNTIQYGEHRIDLSQVEQLIDIGQTRAIGLMIHYYATHYAFKQANVENNLTENLTCNLKRILQEANEKGLDIFSPYKVGNLAMPRLYELNAAINRIRCDDWFSLR